MNWIVLIPPSEGKQEGGSNAAIQAHTITQQLLKEIHQQNPKKLYSSRVEEAEELNKQVLTAKTLPAIQRYTGVLYKALDYSTLNNKEYFNKYVRIPSALFGLIQANKNIPNYKLPITKLQAAKKWKEENSKQLTEAFVIDLLPQAHKKSVSYKSGVEIEFTQEKNGKTVRAGHEGKRIKGLFIRWLAENNIKKEQDIYAFSEEGYSWNGKSFHKQL
ncbi:MAG: peroxide stress protein YaaA [Candidatus Woesearchaeota archaeon]